MNFLGVLLDLVGLATIGLYLYVMIAMVVTDRKSGMSWGAALSRSVIWPLTIWNSIKKLHETKPPTVLGTRSRVGSER
jgi:hypothetical protein